MIIKNNMLDRIIGEKNDLALLIVRVLIGVVFLMHGIQKFQIGIDGIADYFGNTVGIPAPQFFAWVVALTETVGGAALILGIFSRLAGLLLSVVMVVAMVMVKIKVGLIAPMAQGAGMELDLALLAGLRSIVLQGAGVYSLEGNMAKRPW
jgi:uncharacterized membrane protein YphA (DoxX/SURF4 family)